MPTITRCASVLLFFLNNSAFAQLNEAKFTEKEAIFSYVTVHIAKQNCLDIEFNLDADGWVLISLFLRLGPDFAENLLVAAKNIVDASAQAPTFCEDVKNAYGPKGIPTRSLPWAKPEFRGMIK